MDDTRSHDSAPVRHTANLHPMIDNDQTFFQHNPYRNYRARSYVLGEFGFDTAISLFAVNELGQLREIDTIIVKRYPGYRKRCAFSTGKRTRLDDDRLIIRFLRRRKIDPETMRSVSAVVHDKSQHASDA